jgi:pimeloyl-ACP methyl ester carboxylesterase
VAGSVPPDPQAGYENVMADSWLDRGFVKLMRRQPFFSDGWGDPERLATVISLPTKRGEMLPVTPDWGPWQIDGEVEIRNGTFPSPEAELLALPNESLKAVLRQVRPPGQEQGPVCIHLAATGEFGFARRMKMARPLAAAGIGSMLLENPYYGTRAPPGQQGPSVRTVADLLVMGRACVQEARSILGWLNAQGHQHLGVSGFSMGGQTAAMTAAACPFPVVAIPLAGSHSATAVFLDGVLRYVVDWSALAPEGDHQRARDRLKELLNALAVSTLPPPTAAQACIVVCGSRDAFVQPPSSRALHAHWPGAELRWIPTGHVGGYLWNQKAYLQAIQDAFARLKGLLTA